MLSIKNRVKTAIFSLISVSLVSMALAPAVSAAGDTMYLDPATKSVASGGNITESLYINTGTDEADTVNVVVNYDATKLQLVSPLNDTSGNSKSVQTATASSLFAYFGGTYSNTVNGANSSVKWVGSYLGHSTTGQQFVGSITFKALADSGSTSLTMPGGNIAYAGTALNPTLTGTTVNFTAAADTTDPTAKITSPSKSSTVSGKTTVKATASDNKAVTKVEFFVDGKLKQTVSASPYQYTLDTASLSNGSHTFKVTAFDAAGNTGSSSVTVTVNNSSNKGGGSGSSSNGNSSGKSDPKAPDTGFAFSGSNMYILAGVALLTLAGAAVGAGRFSRKISARK